jgi:hypothetical protein
MFRFYLDNNLVDDPLNWSDFTETVERDDTIKGLLPKYEIKLNFHSKGFIYLNNLKETSGFCNLVDLRIEYKCDTSNSYDTIFEGIIFINECRFNLNKCIVECEVEDNNYGARIYRNKSIKVYLGTDKTKNGEALDLCQYVDAQYFTPTTGTYSGALRRSYKVKDAFRFLIEFMTDNKVGFESTYLDAYDIDSGTSLAGGLGLISGAGIRTPSTGLPPFLSFEQLFVEFNKKYPISFTMITGSDGRPTMKIEEEGYFFKNSSSIQLNNIDDIIQSFNNEVLYSSVRFGGKTASFDNTIDSFVLSNFLSFQEEQYFLTGECNIDKTLDLYGDFICDSNIIEEIFATNTTDESYDDDVFFIQINELTNQAFQYPSPLTGGLPGFYNGNLTNDKVAYRYYINGSLTLYLPGSSVDFRASKNVLQSVAAYTFPSGGDPCPGSPETRTSTSTAVYVEFQDDTTSPNFDTAGDYSTSLSRYTASIAGIHVFQTSVAWSTAHVGSNNFNMYHKGVVEFRRFNSGGTLLQSSQVEDPVTTTGFYNTETTHISTATVSWELDVGDYVRVAFWYLYCPVNCLVNSSIIVELVAGIDNTWFKTTSSPESGGEFKPNTDPYLTSNYEFEQPISHDKYLTLKTDFSNSLVFNYMPLTDKTGWIRKMIRKFSTGDTKWLLITNINNT